MSIQSAFRPMVKAQPEATLSTRPKPRYIMVDGEWELKPIDDLYCEEPELGKPCSKCLGSTRLVFRFKDEVKTCHWCTDGRGIISRNDLINYRARKASGRYICYIRTYVAPVPTLLLPA